MAYTPDSIWRNRDTFVKGRDEIEAFLTDKWNREHGYKLRKELFAFDHEKVSRKHPLYTVDPVLTRNSDRCAVLV
jgi:nuclear transport factor 2 (NTF2) superfamily protein